MKTIKGGTIFIIFILLGSCFSPPEFSVVPSISNPNVIFIEGNPSGDVPTPDSLVLTFDFQDGDGDLGLDATQVDDPFHDVFYYLEHDGDTTPITTALRYTDLPPIIKVPAGAVGRLVTVRTREQPEYEDMFPEFVCPYNQTNYQYDSIFVSEENANIFDPSTHNVHRIMESGTNPDLYVLLDTFYYKRNPFHTNITVEFLIKQNDGSFLPYDIRTTLCIASDFSARFPYLTDSDNPLEGTLKYSMESVRLKPIFAGKLLKIRIQIRDRALHVSNSIVTDEFTLEQIRQ
jgi:hypothetical protein